VEKSNKKTGPRPVFLAGLSIRYFNDLLFIVGATSLANLMRNHQRAAFAALNQRRIAHLPIGSAAVSSCL